MASRGRSTSHRTKPQGMIGSGQSSGLACVVVLAAALLAVALPQTAGANWSNVASTPSTTEPYFACPPRGERLECDLIVDPPVSTLARGPVQAGAITTGPGAGVSPALQGSGVGGGFSPEDLRSAYDLPSTSAGSGQTVAVVDAYDNPDAEANLAVYRKEYGIPECTASDGCFSKVNQTGGTSYPSPPPPEEEGWTGEIALDLDMVSAICPNCHILLVEANNSEWSNLAAAENEAATLGATEISNSFSGASLSSEYSSSYDHPGVPITAAGGDHGYGARFPADSPYVIAVGGTTLSKASNSRGWTETVWYHYNNEEKAYVGTGSGCSEEPKPAWQTDTGCMYRTNNDVAAVADENTPVSAYNHYGKGAGWVLDGGTSVATPIIAGAMALANSYTKSLKGAEAFYREAIQNGTGALDDVVSGSNGSCGNYLCEAGPGYDGPTGLGSPYGAPIVTPPTAAVEAVTSIRETSVILHGVVNPEGFSTTYQFEYWRPGKRSEAKDIPTTTESVGSGTSNVKVSQALTGLSQGTEYVYQLAATNDDETFHSPEASFVTGPYLEIQSTPNVGESGNYFEGVSCLSSSFCMAVGLLSEGGQAPFAEGWNGSEWSLLSVPNPTGGGKETYSSLRGVSCTSTTACTAVGSYEKKGSKEAFETLAERWNGTEWSIQSTPNPSGGHENSLDGVSCSSATSCTAVGQYTKSGLRETLAEHWNGTEWSIQNTPNPSGGTYNKLNQVSCTSSTECTSVGSYDNSSQTLVTLAERWNGTEWSIQSTPNPTGAKLSTVEGISCTTSTFCIASGQYENSKSELLPLAERWNGTEWSIQSTPNPTGGTHTYLNGGVSCVSTTSCTSAGSYLNSSSTRATLAEYWNGTEWAIQSTPNPTESYELGLAGVSCSSSTTCATVGHWQASKGPSKTLAEMN
jgi:hypothetical protein